MEDINKFIEKCDELSNEIVELSSKLNEDDISNLRINDDIGRIVTELQTLNKKLEEIKADLSKEDQDAVVNKFKMLKNNFIALKNKHITRYNMNIHYVNGILMEVRLKVGDKKEELKKKIDEMVELPGVEKYIEKDWQKYTYVNEEMNYDELEDYYKKLSEIIKENNLSVEENNKYLKLRYYYLEAFIKKISDGLEIAKSIKDIDLLIKQSTAVYDSLIDLNFKHALDRDNMDEVDFSKWSHKIVELQEAHTKLEDKLMEEQQKYVIHSDNYHKVDECLQFFERKYEFLNNKIYEYSNKGNGRTLLCLESFLKALNKDFNSIDKLVNEDLADYSISEVHLKELKERVEKLNKKRNDIYFKLCNVLSVNDYLTFNSSKIESLNEELDKLNAMVSLLDSPEKDRDKIKRVSELVKAKKKELKRLKNDIDFYKEQEPDKYNALKSEYDKVDTKYEDINKEFRGKCPLKVNKVKDAKNFFKKHKKVTLIIAGLAVVALLHATVGPVLIPAIMRGNIMIANKSTLLRGIVSKINSFLGDAIGATRNADGAWFLANGSMLNPTLASTSLLKGLAISGVGTTALTAPLVAPVVIGIKKVIEKMNLHELKRKMADNSEKRKEERKDKKEKKSKEKNRTKEWKQVKKDILQLIEDYEKYKKDTNSDISIEEYCEENGLSKEDEALLKNIIGRSK